MADPFQAEFGETRAQCPKALSSIFSPLTEPHLVREEKECISNLGSCPVQSSLSAFCTSLTLPTCESYLAAMGLFFVSALFLFLDIAFATPLAALSTLPNDIATSFPRSALHHELRREAGSPLGTDCSNVYSVLDHTRPILSVLPSVSSKPY